MEINIDEKLLKFYAGVVPGYVVGAGKDYITIRTSSWQGEKETKIGIKDVVTYYKNEANDMLSGMRSLAGIDGDWRSVDTLANECLEWFKFINIEELRRESKKAGLVPKF